MFGFLASLFTNKIVKSIIGSITDGFEKRRERKRARLDAEIALEVKKQEAIMKKDLADIEWDQIMAKASSTSWKDEYLTIIISLPFIGVFIPVIQDYILTGFQYLEQTPEDYKIAWLAVVAAALGLRGLVNLRKPK